MSDGKLIIMRHGEGTHNVRYVRDKNASLTEKGRAQVHATGRSLLAQGFNRETIVQAYVSPFVRTKETAEELVFLGVIDRDKIIYDERIVEPDFGLMEGRLIDGEEDWDLSDAHEIRGETLESVQIRLKKFYEELLSSPKKAHILIVSHGTPTQELIALIEGRKIKLATAEAKIFDRT